MAGKVRVTFLKVDEKGRLTDEIDKVTTFDDVVRVVINRVGVWIDEGTIDVYVSENAKAYEVPFGGKFAEVIINDKRG